MFDPECVIVLCNLVRVFGCSVRLRECVVVVCEEVFVIEKVTRKQDDCEDRYGCVIFFFFIFVMIW